MSIPLDHDLTPEAIRHEFGDRWDITAIPHGYRAILKDHNGPAPVALYGRTLTELAESIRMAQVSVVTGQAASTWDVFTGSAAVPPGTLTELAALRVALPDYNVTITSHSRTHRFEAIRRHNSPGPWCVISSDPGDLWHELAGRARPAALDGDPGDQTSLTKGPPDPASSPSPRKVTQTCLPYRPHPHSHG